MPNNPSNKLEPQGTTGGTSQRVKDAFVAMQIKAMQRAAEPITVDFTIDQVPGVKALNRELVKLPFDRKLDGRTLGAINGVLANQIRILLPYPGVTQTVTVQNVISSEAD